jgi:Leucine-rich repeat (LRR) protein
MDANAAMSIAMDMLIDMNEFRRIAVNAKIIDDKKLLERIKGDPASRTEQEEKNDDMIKVIRINKLNVFKDFTLDQLCIQLRDRFKNLEGLSISSVDATPARIPYLEINNKIHHIPESICGFPKLTVLCLRGPILTLPENLGNLTNLTTFRLDALGIYPRPADMQGREAILLPESIGTLENLLVLVCISCNLQVMPPFVSRLSKLQELTIADNPIREIPEEMVFPKSLIKIIIIYSRLESLPESIGNLTNLTILTLYNNQLTTLPASIGNMTKLKKLRIKNNRLTTLPDTCRELTNLDVLDLHNNQFESIPESMTDLSSLETLDLSHNRITSLPDNINKLTRLAYLHLNNNLLTTLPDNFVVVHNHPMEILNLSHNQLTSIPTSVGNLLNLRELNLNHNTNLRILPQRVLNLRRQRNLMRPGTEILLHGTGVRANAQPQGPRVNAHEVHKEFAKIDIRSLFMFIDTKVPRETLDVELRSFDKTRVVATLRTYIVRIPLTEAEQKQLLDRLHTIYTDRLEGYRYDDSDKKVISYCMTYVAAQPERFQSEYARAFVEDCYDAYGNGSVSCVKGVIERFVSTLRLAALLYDGTPEYNSREYGKLASIIGHKKIGSLKERMNLISQECYAESDGDETKFRKCMINTLKAELGNQFNETNSTTKNTLNQVVADLRLFDGGRVRRTHKKRRDILRKRTIKQKGKRKIRATRNKKRTHKRSH